MNVRNVKNGFDRMVKTLGNGDGAVSAVGKPLLQRHTCPVWMLVGHKSSVDADWSHVQCGCWLGHNFFAFNGSSFLLMHRERQRMPAQSLAPCQR